MIVIRIELWPQGDESRKREIGVGHITNVGGSRTATSADYTVKLLKSPEYAKREGTWRRGVVRNFPRKRFGPWDLLMLGLMAAIGEKRTLALVRITSGTSSQQDLDQAWNEGDGEGVDA